jgi:chromosomal replication initiation ATPase DnaA
MTLLEQLHSEHKARRARLFDSEPPKPKPAKLRDYTPQHPPQYIKSITYLQGVNLTRRVLRIVEITLERRLLAKASSLAEVLHAVGSHFLVSKMDLLSQRRDARVMRPRQIVYYLAKELTPLSYPEIGRRIGGRDHTTVLHGVRKIENLEKADSKLRETLKSLRQRLA